MKKHKIVAYDEQELALGGRRLVLLNHIPKTGGSTLSVALNRCICTCEERTLVDAMDWVRLSQQYKNFLENDVFLEGLLWGIENIFSSQFKVFYVTMLRDPLLVFRSNFSYSRRHLGIGKDAEQYDSVRRYCASYDPNFLVNNLAGGDLELAKERLLHTYCVFGITELFEDSVKLISGFFGCSIETYTQQNKSKSEQFVIDQSLKEEFIEKNLKDYELYDFAKEIFKERLKTASFLENAPLSKKRLHESIDLTSYPGAHKEDINTKIFNFILAEEYNLAIDLLETVKDKETHHFQSLANCFWQTGEIDKAEFHLKIAYHKKSTPVLWQLVNFYIATNQRKGFEFITDEIAELECALFADPPDAIPYFYILVLTQRLMECCSSMQNVMDVLEMLKQQKGKLAKRLLLTKHEGKYWEINNRFSGCIENLSLISAIDKEKFLGSIPQKAKVAIYGTGITANVICDLVTSSMKEAVVTLFIDSFFEGKKDGNLVIKVDNINDHTEKFDLVIIASISFSNDMIAALRAASLATNIVAPFLCQ